MRDLSEFLLARITEDAAVARAAEDPARILAECEAKREIVAMHEAYTGRFGTFCASCGDQGRDDYWVDYPCDTLLALAKVYDYHETGISHR